MFYNTPGLLERVWFCKEETSSALKLRFFGTLVWWPAASLSALQSTFGDVFVIHDPIKSFVHPLDIRDYPARLDEWTDDGDKLHEESKE